MKKGLMLVELLVAMAIASLALVALVALTNRAASDASFFRHKTEATTYAREGVEWVKNEKLNQGWQFLTTKVSSTYCINSLSWTLGACSSTMNGLIYSRTLRLTNKSPATIPPRMVATVTVSWVESNKTHSTAVTTELTNF